jgi:SAM-dependent methyltransferase
MIRDSGAFGENISPAELGGRLDAPAFHRNCEPIWSVLAVHLQGKRGDVLEVGSGTGQHVAAFARRASDITWWPSDCEEAHLASIASWRAYGQLANVRAPMRLDLRKPDWGFENYAGAHPTIFVAILCFNVLHIASWAVAEALMAGAKHHLARDGLLFVYGPFTRHGRHTAPSNAAFDKSLRRADPDWGVRNVEELGALAARNRLDLASVEPMPANNLTLVFRPR